MFAELIEPAAATRVAAAHVTLVEVAMLRARKALLYSRRSIPSTCSKVVVRFVEPEGLLRPPDEWTLQVTEDDVVAALAAAGLGPPGLPVIRGIQAGRDLAVVAEMGAPSDLGEGRYVLPVRFVCGLGGQRLGC